jgi:hypothetical protein
VRQPAHPVLFAGRVRREACTSPPGDIAAGYVENL